MGPSKHIEHVAATLATAGALALFLFLASPVAMGAASHVQPAATSAAAGQHAPFDELLELNVRDGLVYYRALQSQRGKLDRYVASLNVDAARYESWTRDAKAAFWLNAYNAIVIRTVVDRYPIRGRAKEYPPNSIRQIPGAFEKTPWRVAGRSLTLDQIEKEQVAAFDDPRMFFALGRGSVGGGRLRSEAFTAEQLDAQLTDTAADCVRRAECARVDEGGGTLYASPIFSWREAAFVKALGTKGADRYKGRTPIELAILAFIEPHLFRSERSWLEQNTFKLQYATYDWRLNDLTGGPPK